MYFSITGYNIDYTYYNYIYLVYLAGVVNLLLGTSPVVPLGSIWWNISDVIKVTWNPLFNEDFLHGNLCQLNGESFELVAWLWWDQSKFLPGSLT